MHKAPKPETESTPSSTTDTKKTSNQKAIDELTKTYNESRNFKLKLKTDLEKEIKSKEKYIQECDFVLKFIKETQPIIEINIFNDPRMRNS
ncbi:hypothetical protein [Candidatus Phytoplasma solani]|uniref:hypothetical protein n=1 Tax=Candidatus Phytoplasma solani TaxID=69896 RepID=UPI00358E8011